MKHIISVYDKKGKSLVNPFVCDDVEMAKRQFIIATKDENSVLSKFKDDYSLKHLADITDIGDVVNVNNVLVDGEESV